MDNKIDEFLYNIFPSYKGTYDNISFTYEGLSDLLKEFKKEALPQFAVSGNEVALPSDDELLMLARKWLYSVADNNQQKILGALIELRDKIKARQ